MQLSSIPAKIAAIFAASAPPTSKNTIPLTQAGIIQPGQASYDVGFPSITMQPAASGGINPYGQDFNGILFASTGVNLWQSAGGTFPFDSAYATSIGGYPKGALLLRTDGTGYWFNTADNNSNDPEGATPTGWVPEWQAGITAVTGLTNTNVTLTSLQYGRPVITLAGTLTGNVQIIFPAFASEQWLVVNNTTGNFSITTKTASGTGVVIASASSQAIWSDGTNILAAGTTAAQIAGPVGAVRNMRCAISSASATATFTADEVVVETVLGGVRYCLPSFNKTVNLATTGAGGMDTGSAPASGFVAIYAIYNPTTGVSALLAKNASTLQTEVYSGANMPSGYTASALVGVWRTTAASLLVPGIQQDRTLTFSPVTVLSSTTTQASATALSIASAVPMNAKFIGGTNALAFTTTAGTLLSSTLSSDNATPSIGSFNVTLGGAATTINQIAAPFFNIQLITPQQIYYTFTIGGGTGQGITTQVNSYTF
ncbi:hypothetical protein ABL840_09240 [Variovorax sp. NFACC27]|uniref:hypothetical protein n=1 Tax=unclassified Variovorax TaxID=663243 RepID=UPI0008949EAF|nr:hypothetical protein SAMN03159371_05250 [Variovorax sp. NFACC28]SEG89737.1 hypothetical protein SAMN03159365_05197 [Variovorax sp. NFACC29]SFD39834.1 hypothetical protein SAMN03159379_05140 [Variovorax sp. NFACC26]SFG42199.1 hypothetical protein SAMN03159447_03250 [Variovorax sp. NFACC27]